MTLYRVRYCDGRTVIADLNTINRILTSPRPVFDIRPVSGR